MAEFQGTDRFDVRRRLGAGGFGVVYEAYDRERATRVALKTLHETDATALYRFKQEFRALADFHHPNLVTLYELHSHEERLFLTMELVEGVRFLDWVRYGAAAPTVRPPGDGVRPASGAAPRPGAPPVYDERRLRSALAQVSDGLLALHSAGKVHRDIKPANVLVTTDGARAVILDLGLATQLKPHPLEVSAGRELIGTLAYMAPEQTNPEVVVPASDWYAVGVMLYEALAGRTPFPGTFEGLLEKLKVEPPPPSALVAGVPADLDALCAELVRLRPEARPRGHEVLRRLAGSMRGAPAGGLLSLRSPALGVPAVSADGQGGEESLFGRARELRALDDALEAVRRDRRTVVVYVHGPSGMGKTALTRRFIDAVLEVGDAVVLSGRCYERESVPYKAVDSLIDGLCRHLMKLPPGEADALLPRDAAALARLFPVLGRVPSVAHVVSVRPYEAPDPQELRHRGSLALRELLRRLGGRAALVLHLDDLQWGDLDSAHLIQDLLRPPDPPPLLLLGCYRTEEAAASPLLRALLSPTAVGVGAQAGADVREVRIGPLEETDSGELARSLLDRGGGNGADGEGEGAGAGAGAAAAAAAAAAELDALAGAIARESHGSPFFLGELARFVRESAGGLRRLSGASVALDDVLRARVARLPAAARALLETVAVAAGPLSWPLAMEAAAIAPEQQAPAVAALRVARLARVRAGTETDQVESAHDRIRVSVVQSLAPDALRDRHARLARALEAAFEKAPRGDDGARLGGPDPEAIADHLRGAGEPQKAARFVAIAAAEASAALAFDWAAKLYALAIELGAGDAARVARLRVSLADALANAGRGADAARAYVEAAGLAEGGRAVELKRRAAEQLLKSGHIDLGLDLARDVLDAAGLRLAPTPRRALLSFAFHRAWVRLRGLRFVERAAADLPADELARIDAGWSLAASLGNVDTVRGADFQVRHLLDALRAGEPYRVARALALEAGYSATGGWSSRRRTAAIVEAAEALSRRVGNPHAIGLTTVTSGLAAFLEGHWRRALDLLDRGDRCLRDRCTNVTWELSTARFFAVWALFYLGRVDELCERVPRLIVEVEERGDLYAEAGLCAGLSNVAWLVPDDVPGARRALDAVIGRWSTRGFQVQHCYDLYARCQVDVYAGESEAAWRRFEEKWRELEGSLMLRIQHTRVVMVHLRARAAIASAAAFGPSRNGTGERERRLALAGRDARRIEREDLPWAEPLVRLLRAGIAAVRGEPDAAAAHLYAAAAGFEDAEMRLFAAVCRHARGPLIGGDEGKELRVEAEDVMTKLGIRAPARFAAMLAPGFAP